MYSCSNLGEGGGTISPWRSNFSTVISCPANLFLEIEPSASSEKATEVGCKSEAE